MCQLVHGAREIHWLFDIFPRNNGQNWLTGKSAENLSLVFYPPDVQFNDSIEHKSGYLPFWRQTHLSLSGGQKMNMVPMEVWVTELWVVTMFVPRATQLVTSKAIYLNTSPRSSMYQFFLQYFYKHKTYILTSQATWIIMPLRLNKTYSCWKIYL